MLQRSITKVGKWEATKTTNGVKTWTANVFRTPLKVYTPLENGFNLELALDVVDLISKNPLLWGQATWRSVHVLDPDYSPEEVLANANMAAYETEMDAPVCGTTMCFAGWATELTKADWVVDAWWMPMMAKVGSTGCTDHGESYDVGAYTEYVLMPGAIESEKSMDCWMSLPGRLSQRLWHRGFTPATHHLSTVQDAAREVLGVGTDPLGLFSAGNNLDQIKAIVDGYAKYGPNLTRAQAEYIFEEIGRDVCNCGLCDASLSLASLDELEEST